MLRQVDVRVVKPGQQAAPLKVDTVRRAARKSLGVVQRTYERKALPADQNCFRVLIIVVLREDGAAVKESVGHPDSLTPLT